MVPCCLWTESKLPTKLHKTPHGLTPANSSSFMGEPGPRSLHSNSTQLCSSGLWPLYRLFPRPGTESPFQLSLCPHAKSLLSPLVAYTERTRLIRCHFWASTAPWAPHPTLTLLPVPPSHPDPLYLCLLMPVLSMLSCHCEFIHIYQHGHVDTCRHAQTPQACTQNDTHVQMYR